MRFLRNVLEWLGHIGTLQWFIQTEFFRTLLLPTLWTVVTVGGGVAQHVPIMWIAVAAALSFMVVTVAILAGNLLSQFKTPRNKLQYQLVFQYDLEPAPMPSSGNRQQRRVSQAARVPATQVLSPTMINQQVPRNLDKGQLGIEIINTATFPITCYLESATTEIEEFTPPRSQFPKPPATIDPGGKIRLLDDQIDLDGLACRRLAGRADLVVRYGLRGKEIYTIQLKGKVSIIMENFGFVGAIQLEPEM